MTDAGVIVERLAVWRPSAACPQPDVSFVPPLARRRLTPLERAALSVAIRVWPDPAPADGLPVVFASRWGEIGTTFKLMRQFHDEGEMSPAAFSVSVHNAAPGAFSLLTKNKAAYTAIAARAATLAAGFLEAVARRTRVIFVYAEEETPAFYRPNLKDGPSPCALAARLDATAWRGGRPPLAPNATFDEACTLLKAAVPCG